MSFARAMIIAFMASSLSNAEGFVEKFLLFAVCGLWWWCTTDPLPAAVERGLDAFARKFRR